VADRVAEDLDSYNSVAALSSYDVDLAIKKRQGLAGQAAMSPLPANCNGQNCLFPGFSGNDNGQGLRAFGHESLNGPAAGHVSLSWDPELIYHHAHMLGGFFEPGGYNGMLGPGAQTWRNPACGRSWEYVPGEDPVLGVMLVEAWTLGLNRQKVSPVLKHYISNDKENDRMLRRGNDTVPWAVQMELALPPFVAGSNIGASTTMCGYHWLIDPEGGPAVSACYDKRLKWLYEESNRTWVVTDYPAAEQVEIYEEPISRSDAGHSWANWGTWKIPLEYERRNAAQQFAQSEGLEEEDNGHQVMANGIASAPRAKKDRFLAGMVGWAKDLGLYRGNRVYTKSNNQALWPGKPDKQKYYKWVSRTIAESFVLLKNEGNLLPLKEGETIELDSSCTGSGNSRKLTATGSGEMDVHLPETRAETAFAGKTGGSPKLTLACSLMSAGEGGDRNNLDQPRPNISDPQRTCVLVSSAGSAAIPWADDVACLIFGIVPSVHGFTGLMYMMSGVVNPGSHLITSVAKSQNDLEYADGPSGRETAYMQFQSKGLAPAYEFGWGLPYGVQSDWNEIVELVPLQHEQSLRRIAFCFKAKFATNPSDHPLPSPTAQFWAQVDGRPFKKLLTFTKFRNLAANSEECMALYYDPVTEWEGGNGGTYVPKSYKLFYGLSGYSSSVEWPAERVQGLESMTPFDRKGYPAQIWRRHLATQAESGNSDPEAKLLQKPRGEVIGFWQAVENPFAAVEGGGGGGGGGSGCCTFGGGCGDCGDDGTGWCHQSPDNCATCTGSWDGGAETPACR